MRRDQEVAILFSEALKIGLLSKFRKIPSSGYIAKEFNLRATDSSTITAETARRWLKGMVLPDVPKLIVLSKWLEIDLNILLSLNKIHDFQEYDVSKQELAALLASSEKIIQSLQNISSDLQNLVLKIKKNGNSEN
jgi:hypothetical protein